LCATIVALTAFEFGVATIAYQIRQSPPRHTDFASYYMAGVFAREGRSPYDGQALRARAHALGLDQSVYPYVYPPAFAVAMRPLAGLSFEQARAAWMLVGALCLGAACVALWALLRAQALALGADDLTVWLVYAAALAAILNSAGVHSDIRVGSVGALLWLAFTVIAWCMTRDGRPAGLCGIALAAATIVKLTPIAVVAWAAWRGARRAALIALLFCVASALPALAVFGPGIHVDWLRRGLWTRYASVDAWAVNQSLAAVVVRLFEPRAMVDATARVPAAAGILIVLASLAIVVATVAVLVLHRRRGRDAATPMRALAPVELGVVVLAILLVMRLTWVHTLAAVAFVWPTQMLALWPRARAGDRGVRWAMVAASAGFFLSSAHLPFLWSERFQQRPWAWFTAAHCLGLLVAWAVGAYALATSPRRQVS